MADVLGFGEEDDLFGDVAGVVGDALDAFRNKHELEGARDVGGVLDHEAAELAVELLVEAIDLGVALDESEGFFGLAAEETIKGVAEHGQRDLGHAGEVDVGFQRGLGGELDGAASDTCGLVADTLEVVGGLHADDHQAELAGYGRAEVHVAEGFFVDFDLELIDDVVSFDDTLGEFGVAGGEGGERELNLPDGGLTHKDELRTEVFQFLVEEALHGKVYLWR